MKTKLLIILSALLLLLFIYYKTSNYSEKLENPLLSDDGNITITSNLESVQIFYKKIDQNFDVNTLNKKAEYFSKDYKILGRTALSAELESGNYIILAKKFRAIPLLKKINITGEKQKIHFDHAFGFRYVNSGTFYHKTKTHKVKSFFFAETELTNREYGYFLTATGREPAYYADDERFNHKEQPVVGINYDDAVAYTKWLSDQTGLTCRLPYEYEWEYVASNGDTSKIFPWGNFERQQNTYLANYHPFNFATNKLEPIDIDGFHFPAPVKSYQKTNKRYFDLAGNVFEWCLDSLNKDGYYPDLNLKTTALENTRIVKGGSWNFNQLMMQIKNRVFVDGRIKRGYNGIRVLVELD